MMNIPGYKTVRLLGSGGMSMVYLAEHGKLGHRVAIKVLSDVLTADETVRKRFLQEARVMASLRHRGIVPVNDFIETENTLAIVMEYVEGRNLSEMIGSEIGPIPFERALKLFKQVLEATEYAHGRGVIHRDLKPSNVMVTPDGTTRIMDFGIAKITGSSGHTRTGTKLGTLYYMSPEQIKGSKDVDKRADIYSLGMTLYEMLAGRLPFNTGDETSEWEISQKIVLEDYEPPSTYYPHIPEWLVQVVQKSTAKKPDDRYNSCEKFILILEEKLECIARQRFQEQDIKTASSNASDIQALEEQSKQPALSNTCGATKTLETIEKPSTRNSVIRSEQMSKPERQPVADATAKLGLTKHKESPVSGMDFVTIPSGNFMMGSPSSEEGRGDNETQHLVSIGSFEIMSKEVTQGMWKEVMGNNPSNFDKGDDHPVESVSWNDCQAFLIRLNELDPSRNYRLPSEAEWEYACRAGTRSRFYWGDSDFEDIIDRCCWYKENSNSMTHPVGLKDPNAWGLYDMCGNVYEWCKDVYTNNYDNCPADGSAYTDASSCRVFRGGSWFSDTRNCRSAYRNNNSRSFKFNLLGFRLARD